MIQLDARQIGNVVVLNLSGRFDAHQVPVVSKWLEESVQVGMANLVINLAGVHFIDSSGLATLVKAMKRCRENDGDLRLCSLQQPVQIIMELTRMNMAFEIMEDEESAVYAFGV